MSGRAVKSIEDAGPVQDLAPRPVAPPAAVSAGTASRTVASAAGNLAMQRLLAAGAIQAKLTIGRADDSAEREADQVADAITASPSRSGALSVPKSLHGGNDVTSTGAGEAPPSVGRSLSNGGQPLDGAIREQFESRLGRGFADVRVHRGPEAESSAHAIGARAYTAGHNIVFGAGQYAPETAAGRGLLAHELTHVVQQNGAGTMVRRQTPPAGGATGATGGTPPDAAAGVSIPLIPPEWAKEPSDRDILVFVAGDKLFALPAAAGMVVLKPPPAKGTEPAQPLFTVPTVQKEGLVVVNIGNRMGFQLDAGGDPIVVFPLVMASVRQALGISSIKGVAITHIHDDHVRSFVVTVRTNRIRPENLLYPAEFVVNPDAKGSTFARSVTAVQSDPALQAFGHGAAAKYGVIQTPVSGTVFKLTQIEGEITFDYYGLTGAFRDLRAQRQRGKEQPVADTASLLTRVTDSKTGYRFAYLGDLRGSDLELFRQGMGDAAYRELLTGVRAVIGFQHHMGALKDPADRTGLINFLRATYLQTGELDVFVQSEETYRGKQFLNRSLIEALRQSGINVHVARGPRGGQAGTATFTPGMGVAVSGGVIESMIGDPAMQREVTRLIRLQRAEEVLDKFERFVKPEFRYTARVKTARAALGAAWNEYLDASMAGVATTAAGRAQPSVGNEPARQSALTKLRALHPVEELLLPGYMTALEKLDYEGPFRARFETALAESRRTGRMSEAGIEALWEIDPAAARRLVGESKMPKSEQRRVLGQLPGQGMPVRARVGAGAMLAIQLAMEIAPLIEAQQARAYDEDVRKSLVDIMWWQSKGVFPAMAGAVKHYASKNEHTTSPSRIQELLNSKDLDYLALTAIDEGPVEQAGNWDRFGIWLTANLKNYKDWHLLIQQSSAIKGEGTGIYEQKWSYRRGKIVDDWLGLSLTEEWAPSEQLTQKLVAAARAMVATTERQIGAVATGPGPSGLAYRAADRHTSYDIFEDKPKATGKKRFKQNIEKPRLYTLNKQDDRTGFPLDSVFFVFPSAPDGEPVPAGYVVVGGADYNTYMRIYLTDNIVAWNRGRRTIFPNQMEALLAKEQDLEDIK